jgi:predicted ATPase
MIVTAQPTLSGKTTIRRFKIKGLYGYLDKDIGFNSDINLLVGINGSGKTSVLNLISWLLQPAIPHLCTTEFKELVLELVQNRKTYRIRCAQTTNQFKLYVEGQSGRAGPLVVQLQRPAGSIRNFREREELLDAYGGLQPVRSEHRTWNFLQALPSPIVIGLERTVHRDKLELQISATKARSLGQSRQTAPTPLRRVQGLASEAFGRYRSRLIQLNDDLRDKMALAAFDIGSLPSLKRRIHGVSATLTAAQITALQDRVAKYFTQQSQLRRDRDPARKQPTAMARDYFRKVKQLLRTSRRQKKGEKDPLWPAIALQFKKINRLFADFERFDANSKTAYANIQQYLDTLNRFFTDSAKHLDFDFDTGNLYFQRITHIPPSPRRFNLENLSSGETQIAILFTYLAFSPGKIFIIDEPELSLHPRWQDEFLDAVRDVMPKQTQLIIATHSPAIVGRHVEYCKTLLPYNE